MHRDVTRTFNHDLHVMLPCDLRKFAERPKFGKLGLVIGIVNRPGT